MTKQIDIKEFIPFLNKGWVACDKSGDWVWFSNKPIMIINDRFECLNCWMPNTTLKNSKMQHISYRNEMFRKIKKPKDWTKSLMKVGGK